MLKSKWLILSTFPDKGVASAVEDVAKPHTNFLVLFMDDNGWGDNGAGSNGLMPC